MGSKRSFILTLLLGGAAFGLLCSVGRPVAEAQRAAAPEGLSDRSCEPISTTGSTHTAGGGALVIPASLGSLAGDSDRIVAGTVTSFRTCIDRAAGGVSTDVTVRVTEHVKSPDGVASPADMTINVPGGKFGQLALYVGTSPEFSIGEQVIVFLRDADGELRLTAGYQGKFSVAANGEMVAGGWGEAAFVLSGDAWFPADIPVKYYVNASEGIPPQLSAANVQTAWTNAFNTWENDPGSDISFSFQGPTTRDSGADQCGPAFPDGNNDLTWGIASSHDASVLARTLECFLTLPGTDRLLDADIEFDADVAHFRDDWRTDGTGACGTGMFDLEAVALHETGHFIGLSHPSSNICGVNGACPVMNASYQGVKHSLCQDDRDGVAGLYPAAAQPTSTNTTVPPTPTDTPIPPTATLTDTPTNTPTEAIAPTNTPIPSSTPPATDTPTSVAATDTPTSITPPTATPTSVVPTATHTPTEPFTPLPSQTPSFTPTFTRTPTRTPTPQGENGDANCSGSVGPTDAALILQLDAGITSSVGCPQNADVNGDGRIGPLDAALILQYDAGIIDALPG